MIRLRLLGESVIEVDGTPVAPDSQSLFAVLLYLAMTRGTRLSRGTLHRLLWPAADEERGRHNLRQALYKLRQLGVDLDATPSSILLRPADVEGEVVTIARDEPLDAARVTRGRGLGEFLPDYAPTFSTPFAEWVEEQRAVLHGQLRRALLATLLEQRRRGAWREVELIARQVLQYDALNEEATLALAEAAAMSGGKSQALGILDRYLQEIGGDAGDIRLPATVLRRRIAERLPQPSYAGDAEDCFVGREESIAMLMEMYQRAREGRGGAVLIWGESGIGKTRLLEEFGKMVVLEGTHLCQVRSRAWDRYRPMACALDIAARLLSAPGALGIAPQSKSLLEALTGHVATQDDDDSRRIASLTSPAQLSGALVDLVDAVSEEIPLVIQIDDAQWLDSYSCSQLVELAAISATRRVLLLLTSPHPHLRGLEAGNAHHIISHHLQGIGEKDITALLGHVTSQLTFLSDDDRRWCMSVTGGNPLHIREIGSHWRSHGLVHELPHTLGLLLASRVQQLPSAERRTLQLCSLLKGHATLPRVHSIQQLDWNAFIDAVEHLDRAGLIHVSGTRLSVRHSLIEDAALHGLSTASAAALHSAIAQRLEVELASEGSSLLFDCTRHWELAGDRRRAIRLLRTCAAFALRMGLAEEAAHILDRAVSLCDTAEVSEVMRDLSSALRQGSRWIALREITAAPLNQRADGRSDPCLALHEVEALWRTDAPPEIVLSHSLSLALDSEQQVASRLRAGTWALALADNFADWATMDRVYSVLAEVAEDVTIPEHLRLHFLLVFHATRGDVERALDLGRALAAASADAEDAVEECRLLRHSAHAMRRCGAYALATATFRQALLTAQSHRIETAAVAACQGLACLALDQSQLSSADYWATKSLSLVRTREDRVGEHVGHQLLLKVALYRSDESQATRILQLHPYDQTDAIVRRRAEVLAVHLRAAVTFDRAIDSICSSALEDAFELYRMLCSAGGLDYYMASLLRALRAVGREDDFNRFAQQYITRDRRELGPLSEDLSVLLGSTRAIGG